MKTEEAITRIQNLIEMFRFRDRFSLGIATALDMAIDALEKQEKYTEVLQKCNSKKRKKITDGFATCRHCHKYIRLPIIEYSICCPECGRQLDLGDEECRGSDAEADTEEVR